MPSITYVKDKLSKKIEVCNKCYVALLRTEGKSRKEWPELCVQCATKCIDAGVPMVKPFGNCASCLALGEFVGEMADHPEFKFCGKCCDPKTHKLVEKLGLCSMCFQAKKVKPAYALGKRLFNLCRPCHRKYAPKS